MKSTPERVEALRTAIEQLSRDWSVSKVTLREMLSECEQELPQPLVFEKVERGRYRDDMAEAEFNRDLEDDDIEAIRAALTKAFPAKEQT